ncbi:hypothetical protein PtrSN002B_002376 [Pyrenophora tritici-repentis]|nr:hypothetical protein A1F94_012359 [Pyrenophora tritici-repentis]KAI0582642.1 hypothetical protein Alg130_06053 [Pyrenophora tritici-repentis]KAI0609767.1 hypothetical protein TUN205_05979 [Pyrenophora tritici-repentis]KAI0621337.1 hypothetical protein TUN199_06665 [Pyrenophora tritici-repentis]KAI1556225.1 hypothetical protein PtrSN002B_002376 [Pyrenophora tritici-repentis]
MEHILFQPENDQGPVLGRVSLAMYTVAVAFVALRCFTRGYIVRKFGIDDLFIAIAVTLGAAQTVTILLQIDQGTGRHASELIVDQMNNMLKYSWCNMLIYFVANWAVKMSILALYYRITSGAQGLPWIVQTHTIWVLAGFITAFSISIFVTQFVICTPFGRVWDVLAQPDGCLNVALFMIASGAINVITDVILLIFPLPLLRLLKFNKRQRTALALILSVGVIPVISSTMRLCEILMADGPRRAGSSWQELDFSWGWAWVPVWSQLEVDIGIVAASLPCLSPLFKHVFFSKDNRPSTPSKIPTLPGYDKSWRKDIDSDSDDDSIIEKEDWTTIAIGKEVDVEKGYAINVSERETRSSTDSDDMSTGGRDEEEGAGGLPRKSVYYDNGLSDIAEEDCSNRSSLGAARQIEVKTLAATGRPKLVEYRIT